MANRERGEIDLAFGDERYTLRMSINAIAEIETYLDVGINDLVGMISNPQDFRVGRWRVILWGALLEFHKCSIDQAGEIMGRAGIDKVVTALGEAMTAAFPEKGADKGDAKNPQ